MKEARAKAKRKKQSGVLAFSRTADSFRLMLVTPRFGGNGWIIPKGNIVKGMGAGDSAEKEAFEEAGVSGRRSRRPVGFYGYAKKGRLHRVAVFLLEIDIAFEDWPERGERKRKLFSLPKALKVLKKGKLWKLAAKLPELAGAVPG